PNSHQHLPTKSGPRPESFGSAATPQELKSIDHGSPSDSVRHGKGDLKYIEVQSEPKRPRPMLTNVPDGDAQQARASHGDQASDQNRGKSIARERHGNQEPDREERQPCGQSDGASLDQLVDHFAQIISTSPHPSSPLTERISRFAESVWPQGAWWSNLGNANEDGGPDDRPTMVTFDAQDPVAPVF